MRHDCGKVGVHAFKARIGAVEQRRRDRGVARAGEPVGDIADMGIDAERFLKDQQARSGRGGCGPGDIRGHDGAVGNGQRDCFGADRLR